MKTRFTTIDILASISELQKKLQGMRVQQVYDIDNKTYLIKLSKEENKAVLLLESGSRIHTTEYQWPKNQAPSGFSMKLRKHLKSRRFEKISMLGIDRIIDIQFGSSEAAYHVIIELYDRGNICLTDYEYTILNLLRIRTDENLDVKLVVREKYPIHLAKQREPLPSEDRLKTLIAEAKPNDSLKKVLNPHLAYGPALIDHVLLGSGFKENVKISELKNPDDIIQIESALKNAENFLDNQTEMFEKGYIIQKKESGPSNSDLITYQEFHPYLFHQHESSLHIEFESFDKAIDEFFSKLEGQKLDLKTVQQEKSAMKKLENVRKDHAKRLGELQKTQENDKVKAQFIEMNLEIVDRAILILRSAIANQIDWTDIKGLLQDAQSQNDPVAKMIKKLKLEVNRFTMLLEDPYDVSLKPILVDIDLDLSAYANARKYYDQKRHASKKEQKTVEASQKALKSAERKTKQTLKEVAVAATINKARKTYWFEKFLWFISSENYLVIGGRDQQQNEMIVKKYLKAGDAYVHADLHGASTIVVKNPSGSPISPKTLNEAGAMAVCCSGAWDAKVITSAWWVNANQVSKTAPSGEYLTTGSFMIRGKKNYLLPCHLIMGFGFVFKLDDEFVELHKNDRIIKEAEPSKPVESHTTEDEHVTEEIPLNEEEDGEASSDNEISESVKELEVRDSDEETEFPDTQITLQPVDGNQFEVQVENLNEETATETKAQTEGGEKVIFLGDDNPVVFKPSSKKQNFLKGNRNSGQNSHEKNETKKNEKETICQNQAKRGQKSKLKKIKNKYKDQDEEEKDLRMKILASAGKEKVLKKKDLKVDKKAKNQKKNSMAPAVILHDEEFHPDEPRKNEENSDDDEDQEIPKDDTTKILDSLTGCPNTDDGLLFAVAVCAPYSTLQNYKYKVKLTPGTGKRGKATKTAVQIFLKNKEITPRERDLLKTVKDQDISRNLPGKVKLSVAQTIIRQVR